MLSYSFSHIASSSKNQELSIFSVSLRRQWVENDVVFVKNMKKKSRLGPVFCK